MTEKTFRGLCIGQPFAHLLTTPQKKHKRLPIKTHENRSWTTNYRGIVLIHASKGMKTWQREAFLALFDEGLIDPKAQLQRGGFVGFATLVDVVTDADNRWVNDGDYHWQMQDPTPMPFIPFRGKLQLFSTEWPWPDHKPGTNKLIADVVKTKPATRVRKKK